MTARERIEEYGMVVPVEEQLGFRKRLAYGGNVVLPHSEPAPRVPRHEPIKVVFEDGTTELL